MVVQRPAWQKLQIQPSCIIQQGFCQAACRLRFVLSASFHLLSLQNHLAMQSLSALLACYTWKLERASAPREDVGLSTSS